VAAVLFACVGCDQVTKNVVRENIAVGYSQSFLGDSLRLMHAENPGAFLSIGASMPQTVRVALFQGGVAIVVAVLLYFALFGRELDAWAVAGFTLLAASGIGNLIDRVMQDGRVTDFLNLGIGSLRTGIFNVADVVGMLGLLLLVVKRRSTQSLK
jgi:signal peptidase II